MPEEINLTLLTHALVQRWKWIIAVTLLSAALGAIGNLIIPTVYEATAIVSIPQNRTSSVYTNVPPDSVRTSEAAQKVISVLASQGANVKQDATALVGFVRVSASPDGSNWNITTRLDNPEMAAQISNAWAEYAAKSINDLQPLNSPTIQLAADNSQKAADALEAFVQSHRLSGYDLYSLARIKSFVSKPGIQVETSIDKSTATRVPDSPTLTSEEKVELATLLRAQEIADAVYFDLMIEAAKTQLLARTGQGMAKVIKPASIPRETVFPKSSENIAIAGIIGLMISVFGILFFESAKQANQINESIS